jgi:hypothetical protein
VVADLADAPAFQRNDLVGVADGAQAVRNDECRTSLHHAFERLVAKRGRPFRASGPEPTFSDSEVITVSLMIEAFFQAMKNWAMPLSRSSCGTCFRT